MFVRHHVVIVCKYEMMCNTRYNLGTTQTAPGILHDDRLFLIYYEESKYNCINYLWVVVDPITTSIIICSAKLEKISNSTTACAREKIDY